MTKISTQTLSRLVTRGASIAVNQMNTAIAAGVITPENVKESDLRQALHYGISAQLDALPGSEFIARVEKQVHIDKRLWISKYRNRVCRPGGLDLYFRVFEGEADETSGYWEIIGETKWASGWGEMYDTVWDLLKLSALTHSDTVETRSTGSRNGCMAIMACVAACDRWQIPGPPTMEKARSKGRDIENPWIAREIFTSKTMKQKNEGATWQAQLSDLIEGRPDLWELRVTGHDDVGSIPRSYPARVKIKCLADLPIPLLAKTEPSHRLRVVSILTHQRFSAYLKTPGLASFPRDHK